MKNNPPGPLSLQQQPTEDVYQGERARSRWGVQRQAETRATATHGDTLLSWVAHSSKEKSNCVPGSRWGQVCPRQTAGKVSPTCKVKWETLVWVASVGLLQDPHCFWSLPYLVNPHFWHVLPLCLRPRSSCQAVLSFHLLCPSIHISTSVSYLMFIIQNTNTPSLCRKKKKLTQWSVLYTSLRTQVWSLALTQKAGLGGTCFQSQGCGGGSQGTVSLA